MPPQLDASTQAVGVVEKEMARVGPMWQEEVRRGAHDMPRLVGCLMSRTDYAKLWALLTTRQRVRKGEKWKGREGRGGHDGKRKCLLER